MPPPPLPVQGYKQGLFVEVSSTGIEDFSSFHIPLRSMSPLIPRRWKVRTSAHYHYLLLPSRVIDRLGHRDACDEATCTFTFRYNLERCASSFQRMLSEGFTMLLSRHDASRATGPWALLALVGLAPTGLCVLDWTRLCATDSGRYRRWSGRAR